MLRLANAIANLSVCRPWRACTLLRGFNFSGTFLHHIVAWPFGNSLTHSPKSRRSSNGITPYDQISLTGVWLCDSSKLAKPPISSESRLAISSPDEFLVKYRCGQTHTHRRWSMNALLELFDGLADYRRLDWPTCCTRRCWSLKIRVGR